MCSARSRNGPTRVKTIDKQLKNESVKKEDAEFCGENLIVRKLKCVFHPMAKCRSAFLCINDGILGEIIYV